MNLEVYVKELKDIVKVNERAVEIARIGQDMDAKPHMGLYIPYLRVPSHDALLVAEFRGKGRSRPFAVGKVTGEGVEILVRERDVSSQEFRVMVENFLKDMEAGTVYTLRRDRVYRSHLRRYIRGTVTTLDEFVSNQGMNFDSLWQRLGIPWDPLEEDRVEMAWTNSRTQEIETHVMADLVRMHHIYLLAKTSEFLGGRFNNGKPLEVYDESEHEPMQIVFP